jgi:hypothetical protein
VGGVSADAGTGGARRNGLTHPGRRLDDQIVRDHVPEGDHACRYVKELGGLVATVESGAATVPVSRVFDVLAAFELVVNLSESHA